MKVKIPSAQKSRIEMIPLIDIVFLVLVSFIYATLSMAVHKGMPVCLPKSSAVKPEKKLVLSVTIDAEGKIYVNKQEVLLEDLSVTLSNMAKGHTDPGVLLFADKSISYQELFKVLDKIKISGLERISLQAEAER
ncbi:MAG: biopolymer transporter ExbD [Proteobacteria bacterium]|nr:biopolymer transporter ExbD [Pseudomonadota bacterium]